MNRRGWIQGAFAGVLGLVGLKYKPTIRTLREELDNRLGLVGIYPSYRTGTVSIRGGDWKSSEFHFGIFYDKGGIVRPDQLTKCLSSLTHDWRVSWEDEEVVFVTTSVQFLTCSVSGRGHLSFAAVVDRPSYMPQSPNWGIYLTNESPLYMRANYDGSCLSPVGTRLG